MIRAAQKYKHKSKSTYRKSMLLDTVTILSIALRNPFVLAIAILSFGSILATLGTPVVALLSSCSQQRRAGRRRQEQQQRSRLVYHHGDRPRWWRSSSRVVVLACGLVMVALALFLAVRSPYWTFALEAAGWASLAYVSFESGIPKEQETEDESTADDNDSGSQATVSADAEDAFADVLCELKGRFSRTERVRLFQRLPIQHASYKRRK
jgi:hypothetical protein